MASGATQSGEAALPVIYVAGTGRSGSTLLGNALGSLPGALSVGEVRFALRRGILDRGMCGCRRLVLECPVWSYAFESTFGEIPSRREIERLDLALTRLVRRRRARWWAKGGTSAAASELVGVFGSLLVNVARGGAATVLVDSSKLATFGALLRRSPKLRIVPVHLTRDPRAVAYSWQRRSASQALSGYEEDMERLSPAKAAAMWLHSAHITPSLLEDGAATAIHVRYDDFVRDPRPALTAASRAVGSDPSLDFVSEAGIELAPSHAVAGNPNRVRAGAVALRPDDEWRSMLSPRDRRLVSLVTLPARRRLGY